MKKIKWLVATTAVVAMTGVSTADFSQFTGPNGYMNVSDINGASDGPGASLFGSQWTVTDLKAETTDDRTFQFFPNENTYADNVNKADADRAYWTDSADGGVTAGNDGNKWMEAVLHFEHTLVAGETEASMNFSVGAFDLDSRYSLRAFVKILDPDTGYTATHTEFVDITGIIGTTTLSVTNSALVAGDVLQFGFEMQGINANPATDWGSGTVTFESVDVIPEPATIGLITVASGMLYGIRRRKLK
jgi:hypothetical protein